MTQPGPRRHSGLPYDVLAGVEPVRGGWLVAPGNLQGITLAPQPPFVLPDLAEVLDYRPTFKMVAIHSPVGTTDTPDERRLCDVTARKALGPRGGAVIPAPSRALLEAGSWSEARRIDPTLDPVRWQMRRWASESIREVQSWRQRSVWEVNPELAYLQMNEQTPLKYGRRSEAGVEERTSLLERRMPGSDRILAAREATIRPLKLADALADLWIARRIVARAITRMSEPPEWDREGVRMDIVF